MTVQDTSPTPMCLCCFTHHRLEEEKISMHTTTAMSTNSTSKRMKLRSCHALLCPLKITKLQHQPRADNNVSQTSTEYSKT